MKKKIIRKSLTNLLCAAVMLAGSTSAFAAGYEVIKEPWLDADMGITTVDDEYYSHERELYLYPTVFKTGNLLYMKKPG